MLAISLLKNNDFKFYYLTENLEIYDFIKSKNIPCIFWSPNSFKKSDMDILLQAKVVVSEFDHSEAETCKILYSLLYGALKVQCWHGRVWGGFSFLKENLNEKFVSNNREFSRYLQRKSYDYLMSPMLENEAKNLIDLGFEFKHIKNLGNPKLDLVKFDHTDMELMNVDTKVLNRLKKSQKVKILIIPSSPISIHTNPELHYFDAGYLNNIKIDAYLNHLDLDKLDKSLDGKNVEVYIKHHAIFYDSNSKKNNNYNNIIIVDGYSDIYPTLIHFDYFVTDWSSVMLDLLFLEKPIILSLDYSKLKEIELFKNNLILKEFYTILFNCKNKIDFENFLLNPRKILDQRKSYKENIKSLNKKYNFKSFNKNSSSEYIDEISKLL